MFSLSIRHRRNSRKEFEKGPASPLAEGAEFSPLQIEHWQMQVKPCSEGTREAVLKTIQDWASSTGGDRGHIFWLNGMAGTGKSAIAATIGKWGGAKRKSWEGVFFFSRTETLRGDLEYLLPTLAFQLAQFNLQYMDTLYNTPPKDKFDPLAKYKSQFDQFIRVPLSACQRERPILFVLDALDECYSDVTELLHLLLALIAVGPKQPSLRFLITSTPKPNIRSVFDSPDGIGHHEKFVLHNIDDDTARNDVRGYLVEEFAEMHSGTRNLGELPEDWPSEADLEKLLDRCGNFFAYAASVIEFIGDEDPRTHNAVGWLDQILRLDVDDTNPYLKLDELYMDILEQVSRGRSSSRHIQLVITTVMCLRDLLSIGDLAVFLSTSVGDISTSDTLLQLHSVVIVPDDPQEPVRFFHHSFPDFIRDLRRCTEKKFLVNIPAHENFMALQCINLMRTRTLRRRRQ